MSDYAYNYTYVPPLAMVETLPSSEKPTLRWYLAVVHVVLGIAKNRLAPADRGVDVPEDDGMLPLDHLGVPDLHLPSADLESVDLDATTTDSDDRSLSGLLGHITSIASAVSGKGLTDPFEILATIVKDLVGEKGRPQSIEDYRSMFRTIPLPSIADDATDNAVFGGLRVAGYNPLLIQGVDAPCADFPVTDAHFAAAIAVTPALAGDSLAAAGKEGRLYLADYKALADVVNGNFPDGPKYMFAPRALFVRPRTRGDLVPVAIMCGQDPESYRVFGNADGEAWRRAKLVVNAAESNHHELVSHLGRTHLIVEVFAIATPRRLPEKHPIRRLLQPHCEGTLSINDSAQKTLITAGHQVDEALGGTIDASRTVAVQAVESFEFEASFVPNLLESRKVTDPALAYPYRDDARKLWGAIRDWAQANVVHAYADDAALQADADLVAWAKEIAAEDGGRLRSFGEDGQRGVIRTRAWLTDALTMVIFTASCQHAAVNFAQAQLMTYAPAVPGAMYRPAPLSVADTTRNPPLDLLPPLDAARVQLEFLYLLGSVHYTTLGAYPALHFFGTGLTGDLETFQARLRAIEAEIDAANQARPVYTLLKPSLIPQSINI